MDNNDHNACAERVEDMKSNETRAAGASIPGLHRRRLFLARCLGLSGSVLILPAYSEDTGSIRLSTKEHLAFVEQALAMKNLAVDGGDQPYGAVVVKNGQVVGFGPSRVITAQDPTAHAEMEAIRDASKNMGRDLSGCVLYSTSRPCRMCETAAYWANVSMVYFGNAPTPGGKPAYGC